MWLLLWRCETSSASSLLWACLHHLSGNLAYLTPIPGTTSVQRVQLSACGINMLITEGGLSVTRGLGHQGREGPFIFLSL